MKPHFIIYFLLSAFILPINAQTFPQPELWLRDTAAQDKTSDLGTQDLIRCYHLLISNRNDETKINYFNSFPGSYTEFVRFFGYNDNADGVVYGNLYEESLEYISEFFLLNKEINHNDFSNKIIGICINGKWEADAVNYFQTHVRNIVTSSHQDCCCDNVDKFNCYNDTLQNAFLSCLTHYEEKHILSFWRFYFDRPAEIPINKELYSLTRHVLLKYPKLDKLLQDIYSSQNDSLLEDAGSERIASRIGNECWADNPFGTYEKPSPEWTALEEFQDLPNELSSFLYQ